MTQAVELFEDHQDVASAILVLREAGRMCATSFIQTLRPGTLKIGALIAKDLVFGEGNLKAAAIEGSFEGVQESMEQWKAQQDSAFH